jgi:SAM-dependent methyltransferase
MSTWKALLLQEAKKRFEEQQQAEKAAAASSDDGAVLMAPISPSPPALVQAALERLGTAASSSGDTPLVCAGAIIIDLGCGDGRWLLAAARRFPGVRCVGYDLDEVLLGKADAAKSALLAEQQQQPEVVVEARSPRSTIEFCRQDLMLADVSHATVVVAYLFREGCAAVIDKLECELPAQNTAVLSVGFALRGWEARWALRVEGSVPCYYYSPVN